MKLMVKFSSLFKIFLLVSFVFFAYQLIMLIQISKDIQDSVQKRRTLIRGTHEKQFKFYIPSQNNTFKCFQSYEQIEYFKVNDDYCDCLDGTDEPGTNACGNGIFYCEHQSDSQDVSNFVSSYKVNDGICDCCDGSDEWNNNQLLTVDGSIDGNYIHIV